MAVDEGLTLTALDVDVRVRCAEPRVRALLTAHYGRMRAALDAPDLDYAVVRSGRLWLLTRDGVQTFRASDPGELLLLFDQDLIITLQKRRPELYCIHAAALESAGKAFLLVAASGGGKSMTAWALLHHGFRYLSDELSPVDLTALSVHPYPRALVLKSRPAEPYPLTLDSITTSRGFLIPVEASWGVVGTIPRPLHGIFFVCYTPQAPGPSIRTMSGAEACARLYANVLNALAHREDGLEAAIRVTTGIRCYELSTGDLPTTCALVKATLEQDFGGRRSERE